MKGIKLGSPVIAKSTNGKMVNPMTTAGDIIIGGVNGAPTRLAQGPLGYLLAAGESTPVYTNSLPILSTAPTSDNTEGGLKIVILESNPEVRYAGYLYIIAPPPPEIEYIQNGEDLTIINAPYSQNGEILTIG